MVHEVSLRPRIVPVPAVTDAVLVTPAAGLLVVPW